MNYNILDYTKYRLKPKEELEELFKEIDEIFIIWCKKCYKKFEEEVPECNELNDVLNNYQKKIIACLGIDFLCNSYLTKKKINELIESKIDIVGIISCGLGIQTVAKLIGNKKVIALSDTIPQSGNATSISGYHGIALEEEKCGACGQCYLEITGGICPIVECSKSLINGPCGGSKNGKCEVNPDKDCAWVKIYERLKKQKRNFSKEIKIRNYNKFTYGEKSKISFVSIENRKEGFYGGVHPLQRKEITENIPVEKFPSPEYLIVFLSQHTGLPAKPIVRIGERVKVGQKIGEIQGFISSSIHSPVSGKVISIEEKMHPSLLKMSLAIIIENDFLEEIDPSIKPFSDWENMKKEELIEIIKEKGIVGLGGAMFPTHVKLSPPKPVDTLIVNGCECEPYLNGDNRLMIEFSEEIFQGIKVVRKILDVENVIIGIEENKPLSIENMKKVVDSSIIVKELKTKYPEGAEKILIKTLLGRVVPDRGLPFDVGVVVLNVTTIFSIYQAIFKGTPLFERVVTVSGENCIRPGNYLIKIGTPLKNIVDYCFTQNLELDNFKLYMGGPMMGIEQKNLDTSVIKGTTGYTLIRKSPVSFSRENECIKCGRCVDVCPMELYPLYYVFYGKREMWDECVNYNVKNCIECGCCEYICSSKIKILDFIKEAKKYANNKS
jgi:electron transport complex protein RnfC